MQKAKELEMISGLLAFMVNKYSDGKAEFDRMEMMEFCETYGGLEVDAMGEKIVVTVHAAKKAEA